MGACAVLHVTSLLGGGVDRHIRDIVRSVSRRHLVWHADPAADVIELPAERRFFVIEPASSRSPPLADWLRKQGVGLVHAHSMSVACRRQAGWAAEALATPTVATLHDVLFLRADGLDPAAPRDADPAWLAETSAFLARARARLAPSDYLAGLARDHLPALPIEVVPNGSPPASPATVTREPNPDFAARRKQGIAAVLGAIGPHKGARVLEQAARLLEGSGHAIVILGYLDAQVEPGWRNDHLYVHGACGDHEVASLVQAYGARLALFPNQVPESFSYALSDLWSAGLPAIVPPEGALAERVARHGGGWLLPPGFGAPQVAELLRRLLSDNGAAEVARVKSALQLGDGGRVPTLDLMSRSLEALYARFGIDPAGPVDPHSPPGQELLAKNLDGALFRQELARVADELAQVKAGLEIERSNAAAFAAEARGWIAKLEGDVKQLQDELATEFAERTRLAGEAGRLEAENALLAVHKAAFDRLPEWLRRYLLREVARARG